MSVNRELWRNAKGNEVIWRLVYHTSCRAPSGSPGAPCRCPGRRVWSRGFDSPAVRSRYCGSKESP